MYSSRQVAEINGTKNNVDFWDYLKGSDFNDISHTINRLGRERERESKYTTMSGLD